MYTTHSVYTYDEYKKMIRVITRPHKILLLISGVFLILSCILLKSIVLAFIFSLFLIPLFILEYLLVRAIRTKSYWKSEKQIQELDNKITFNENNFKIENPYRTSIFSYDHIYKIIETDTNFYICISKQKCVIIIKNNCSDELINFIKKLN